MKSEKSLGLFEELGPFRVKDYGATVYSNDYSWNLFANVLFLESPSGVGWSFNTYGKLNTTDDEVSQHNYQALVDFLRKFPEYHGRDTFITGESYAGVYVPTLAVKILKDKENFPNFKGIAIGNGALNFLHNYDTMFPLYYYHGLVRDEYIFNATNDLDPYNIYNTCYSTVAVGKKAHIERFMRKDVGVPPRTGAVRQRQSSVPLCDQIGNTEDYLNRADVRKALHIPTSLPRWQDCSARMISKTACMESKGDRQTRHDNKTPVISVLLWRTATFVTHYDMTPEIEEIISAGVKGKERVNEPWRYLGENPTVAGFLIKYEGGLDFLTVRGSGHFVPGDKPREALQMIYNFVSGHDYSRPTPF
ncbi:serine carboxypeptidase [Teladorsagia circumcincta]|uniref:Carboxypeptidase n=1 Tax=Teladorsagia circumcincta TaxID=45464 RepID=A0A2G9V3T3_TELCI|nr:serine carboxypeptidase [Teladorsagia circumcincta]